MNSSDTNRRAFAAESQLDQHAPAGARESGGACIQQVPGVGADARGEHISDGAASRPVGEGAAPSAFELGFARGVEVGRLEAQAEYWEGVVREIDAQRAGNSGQSPYTAHARKCANGHVQGRYDEVCSACGAQVLDAKPACSVCGGCQPIAAYGGWVCSKALGEGKRGEVAP